MPFGKHAGSPLETNPTPYLLWVLRARRHLDPALRRAICGVLTARGCPVPPAADRPPPPDWPAVIRRWYHELVLAFHPDRGGSHEAMKAINEAHDRLRRLVGL